MTAPDTAPMLVVGKDLDGRWTVRQGDGLLLGRFVSSMAAHRCADHERRLRPLTVVASSERRPRLAGRLTLGRRPAPDPAPDA